MNVNCYVIEHELRESKPNEPKARDSDLMFANILTGHDPISQL